MSAAAVRLGRHLSSLAFPCGIMASYRFCNKFDRFEPIELITLIPDPHKPCYIHIDQSSVTDSLHGTGGYRGIHSMALPYSFSHLNGQCEERISSLGVLEDDARCSFYSDFYYYL